MKRVLTLILAFALISLSASCGENTGKTTSVNPNSVSSSDTSSVTSDGAEIVQGEWWNTERLNDWGLKS